MVCGGGVRWNAKQLREVGFTRNILDFEPESEFEGRDRVRG
jgi:hypothetical protein